MFVNECPTCRSNEIDAMERLKESVAIMNGLDTLNTHKLYTMSLDKLKRFKAELIKLIKE